MRTLFQYLAYKLFPKMKPPHFLLIFFFLFPFTTYCQDLSLNLPVVNSTANIPMQPKLKSAYLDTIHDTNFGTIIRRISDAGVNGVIVPMYSTVQAWNSDESFMILYNQSLSTHILLDGRSYEQIRLLSDINPTDLEDVFWDFNDPDILYYADNNTSDFYKYHVSTSYKEKVVKLDSLTNCSNGISFGNDVQMMSWDSKKISFRCGNSMAYEYDITTGQLSSFNIMNIDYTAPTSGPSGQYFYHIGQVYESTNLTRSLNESNVEHSCIGKLTNGNDAHFAIAFAQGPLGGCIGTVVAHDLTNGDCFEVIPSQNQGYPYSQSGTHISALSHKNTEGGWLAASMMGYDQDGQSLLDQEIIIAKADQGQVKVCRIGHHRSDEDQFDYWGEPHAVISPTGTRVLFGSDWSGSEDGQSVDSYVIELPAYLAYSAHINVEEDHIWVGPNPFVDRVIVNGDFTNYQIQVLNNLGQIIQNYPNATGPISIDLSSFSAGIFFISIQNDIHSELTVKKIIKQ